jgi:hypothetical protein
MSGVGTCSNSKLSGPHCPRPLCCQGPDAAEQRGLGNQQPPAVPAQGNWGAECGACRALAGPPIEALEAAPVPTEASVTERGEEVTHVIDYPEQGRDGVVFHALGHQNHRWLHQ